MHAHERPRFTPRDDTTQEPTTLPAPLDIAPTGWVDEWFAELECDGRSVCAPDVATPYAAGAACCASSFGKRSWEDLEWNDNEENHYSYSCTPITGAPLKLKLTRKTSEPLSPLVPSLPLPSLLPAKLHRKVAFSHAEVKTYWLPAGKRMRTGSTLQAVLLARRRPASDKLPTRVSEEA